MTVSAKVGVDVGGMAVAVNVGIGAGVGVDVGVRLAQATRRIVSRAKWSMLRFLLGKVYTLFSAKIHEQSSPRRVKFECVSVSGRGSGLLRRTDKPTCARQGMYA